MINIQNEVNASTGFIDEDMLEQIAKHANERAERDLKTKGKNTEKLKPVD